MVIYFVAGPGESPNGNTDSEEAQADVVDVSDNDNFSRVALSF